MDHESLRYPSREEMVDDSEPWLEIREARDLSSDVIEKILSGEIRDPLIDRDDLREVLLRRSHEALEEGVPKYIFVGAYVVFIVIAFFGWKLFQSLKEKERKKEEKKKLKQKKKK